MPLKKKRKNCGHANEKGEGEIGRPPNFNGNTMTWQGNTGHGDKEMGRKTATF